LYRKGLKGLTIKIEADQQHDAQSLQLTHMQHAAVGRSVDRSMALLITIACCAQCMTTGQHCTLLCI